MIKFTLFQQLKFEGRWVLNNFKTHLKLEDNESTSILSFAILNYLNKEFFKQNPAGKNRHFCILNQTSTPVSRISKFLRKKIFHEFGIIDFQEEPMFGIFLGVINEGGFVQKHIDPIFEEFYHLRINFLLSKPIEGGVPIIKDNPINVEEGESWLNLASEWPHECTPVIGPKHRVVLSLGGLVEKNYLNSILSEKGITI